MKHVILLAVILSGCGADESSQTKSITCPDGSDLFLTETIEEQVSPSNETLCQKMVGKKSN
jgi:hypothetical protein